MRTRIEPNTALAALTLVTVVSSFSALSSTAHGGMETAIIAGTVMDQTGAVLPGVTKQSRTGATSDDGQYRISGLVPSQYMVRAELAGFGTATRDGITATIGAALDVDSLQQDVTALRGAVTASRKPREEESRFAESSLCRSW